MKYKSTKNQKNEKEKKEKLSPRRKEKHTD